MVGEIITFHCSDKFVKMEGINNSQRSKKARRRRKRGKQKQSRADSSVPGVKVGASNSKPSPQVASKPSMGKSVTPPHTKKRPLELVQRSGKAMGVASRLNVLVL